VRAYALPHSATGYKRLAWAMVDRGIVCLRPWQVYHVLSDQRLLRPRDRVDLGPLRRPAPADRPDQVWHVDLMYVYVRPRWYYLVDVLDAYSRYLVHWTLNATMTADSVTLTMQQAVDTLSVRVPAEPKIVHDHGSQFLNWEWRAFVEGTQVTDTRTRVAHPESNGRLERLHRTHREEGLVGEGGVDYRGALEAMRTWGRYYNTERPHSALGYLYPVDYYRGDPERRLEERESKLAEAKTERTLYWKAYADVEEQREPLHL
jgi:putative transposase